MWAELAVVEDEHTVQVVAADDIEDWLACFEKSPDFPARAWAERMAALYNAGGWRAQREVQDKEDCTSGRVQMG